MAISRPNVFWIALLVVGLAAFILLRQVLLPFAIAFALAYVLAPVIERLESRGIRRSVAAPVLVLFLVVITLGVILALLPAAIGEIRFFTQQFPSDVLWVNSLIADSSRPWLHKLSGEELRIEQLVKTDAAQMGGAWVDEAVRSIWAGGRALFSLISLVVVVPIVAIYLLVDWTNMSATVEGWLPPSQRDELLGLGQEIHDAVGGFIRGQVLICVILALGYSVALVAIGLHHAVLIGVAAGLISFIPYLGAGTGFVVAMCVAVAQFWPAGMPLVAVGGVFLGGELLADYVLSPRIIGDRVKLGPVWLMLALFAFGALFGIIGLIIAIPAAAAIGAALRLAARKSLAASGSGAAPTGARRKDIGVGWRTADIKQAE